MARRPLPLKRLTNDQKGRIIIRKRVERRRSTRDSVTPSKQQRHCPKCEVEISGADLERGRCTQCDTNLTLWDIWTELRRRFKGGKNRRRSR